MGSKTEPLLSLTDSASYAQATTRQQPPPGQLPPPRQRSTATDGGHDVSLNRPSGDQLTTARMAPTITGSAASAAMAITAQITFDFPELYACGFSLLAAIVAMPRMRKTIATSNAIAHA